MSQYPPFQLNRSRHNQETFIGRFYHCLDLIDPRTLLTSEAELQNSIRLIDDFQNGRLAEGAATDAQLWRAAKIKQAIIHPDTGEKIFMPFRMSGFVPFGSPIVTGLLLPNPTMISMIFWQWLNQSHNACVNYANRNATKPTGTSTILQGYFGATSAAVSISVGLSVLLGRAERFSYSTRMLILRFIPYPAVASASVLNVILMRRHELSQGIEVLDSKGNVVGTSKIAAKKALWEMAISRAVIAAPVFILPPAIMTQLEKTKWLKANPRLHLPLNALFATLAFAFGLPLGIAVFPQMSQVKRKDLEVEIRKNTKEEVLQYNKGL